MADVTRQEEAVLDQAGAGEDFDDFADLDDVAAALEEIEDKIAPLALA